MRTVDEGKNGQFKYTGPADEYQWTYKLGPLPTNVNADNQQELIIYKATLRDVGFYECKATTYHNNERFVNYGRGLLRVITCKKL